MTFPLYRRPGTVAFLDDDPAYLAFARPVVAVFKPNDGSIPSALINYPGVIYNATGMSFFGPVLALDLASDEHLFDLLHGRELEPVADGRGAVVDVFLEPARIAELECIPVVGREQGEERPQPLRVEPPARGELEEDGPELVSQDLHALDEGRHRFPRILELLHVRYVPAGLGGENEIVRHRVPPLRQRLLRRQLVEGVVYLHRFEVVRVESQHRAGARPPRVERAFPVVIVPARSPDVQPLRLFQLPPIFPRPT